MGELAFLDDQPLFDGNCVRFTGRDGGRDVLCGVTTYALIHCDEALPRHGLVPGEAFLAAYAKRMVDIHDAARRKYARKEFEAEGPVRIMVHRKDLDP